MDPLPGRAPPPDVLPRSTQRGTSDRVRARIRAGLADPDLAEYAFVLALIALVSYVALYVR